MDITVTARHCAVPESIRARAEERVRRLTRYETRLLRAEVIFDTDHGVMHVEARLFVARGATIVAEGSDHTFRAALDQVLRRVGRRLKRQRERRREHRGTSASELGAPAGGA